MQIYELGYLILPSIAEGELPAVVDKIKDSVIKAGGKEIDGEAPFKYNLAYTMSKTVGASRYVVKDAYIGWTKFELDPEQVSEVKDGVEKTEEILRFLLIKTPRETTFTFAKAKAALAEKEREDNAEVPAEVAEEVIQ